MFSLLLIWAVSALKFTECKTCYIKIDDQLWHKQWHLGGNNAKYNMNVIPAWQSCANGTGVTVGVVDNGIQNHKDLNIVRYLNAGYNQNSQTHQNQYLLRGSKRQTNWGDNAGYIWNYQYRFESSLKHGTRAAGLIAAKKNNLGVIGIAFGADIADIRIASTSGFKSFDPTLLNHRSQIIDVYSCSFANFHTGTKTYHLLKNQEKALHGGTTYGRGALGSVYVFATGNSGGSDTDVSRDSCAYDRLVTNRYVISVAGIQHNLKKLPNGEACSAMMVTAFTATPGSWRKVITTDIRNGYTENFNQNSAAAPMVSGAVALALSANPHLTYRDIMHLLVTTSKSSFPEFKKASLFTRNAAGHDVSSYFGFGLLDIGSLVESSKIWKNVPPRVFCHKDVNFNTPLQENYNLLLVKISACRATYVEHVEVSLKVNHKHAGQIKWVLVSPYGTKSTILPGRGLDATEKMDLIVLTVQLWGENPNGYWRLKPIGVFGKKIDHGIVENVGLTIHGYMCTVQQCLSPANQEEGSWSKWAAWGQCTTTCGQGIKIRYRECKGHMRNRYCVGEHFQTEACNVRHCQFKTIQTANGCKPPETLFNLCVEQCEDDTACFGLKCCFNGCGHTCEDPITYDATVKEERPYW